MHVSSNYGLVYGCSLGEVVHLFGHIKSTCYAGTNRQERAPRPAHGGPPGPHPHRRGFASEKRLSLTDTYESQSFPATSWGPGCARGSNRPAQHIASMALGCARRPEWACLGRPRAHTDRGGATPASNVRIDSYHTPRPLGTILADSGYSRARG